jgi:fatty-acyl-CoA synthase
MLEAHFGVPWAGVPLVGVNTRLSVDEVRYILEHSESSVLVHDPQFDELVTTAVDAMADPPLIVRAGPGDGGRYEALLDGATPTAITPSDETALLSINYTSGTTGRPKGVMYAHRGAYLQSLAMLAHTQMSPASSYLWTLPMFHCNGWSFPWAVTAATARHVCLHKVDGADAWRLIGEEEGDAPVRGSGGAHDAAGLAGCPQHGSRPTDPFRHRRRAPQPDDPRHRKRTEPRRDPRLRLDRDVRPLDPL